MKVSISKSVGRAFEILEVFRELRRPATATEIRRQIGCPHSSVVAVLHNLVDLEYLSYDRETKHFFPTYKIYRISTWIQGALVDFNGGNREAATRSNTSSGANPNPRHAAE